MDLEEDVFGPAIKRLRKQMGLSQPELGKKVGVTAVTISRYENEHREPSEETAQKIADALGVSVEELHELDEQIRSTEEEPAGEPSGCVSSERDVAAWRDLVIRDTSIDPWVQMLLMTLPIFLDRTSWVAPITIDQFVRETGRTRELVEEHWQAVLESQYIQRIGENEWTLRLVFP